MGLRGLSLNPSITWDIVQANPDKPWNWYYLSKNPSITWEIVQANPDKDWSELSQTILNPTLKDFCKEVILKEGIDVGVSVPIEMINFVQI